MYVDKCIYKKKNALQLVTDIFYICFVTVSVMKVKERERQSEDYILLMFFILNTKK